MQGARITRAVSSVPVSFVTKKVSSDVQQAIAAALEARRFPPEIVKKISKIQCTLEQVNSTLEALETKVGLDEKEIHKLAARRTTLFKVDVASRLDLLSKCNHENDIPRDALRKLVLTTSGAFALNEASFTKLLNKVQLLVPFYKRMNVPEGRWFMYRVNTSRPPQVQSCFEFLVGFAGEDDARKIIQRYPRIVDMDTEKQLKPHVEKCRGFGLSNEQLVKVICIFPKFLDLIKDRSFLPKRAFFEELGFSQSDIVKLVASFPGFACSSTKEQRRKVDFMVDYCGIQKQSILRVFKRTPGLLGLSIEKQLKPKVDYLASLGISGKPLEFLFKYHGGILFKNMETLEARIKRFEKLGFTQDQYLEIVKKQPSILNYTDPTLLERISFLRRFCKVPIDVLVGFYSWFRFGFETRIKPRARFIAWLHQNGLMRKNYQLNSILNRSEAMFLKVFVTPYNEEAEAKAAYAYCHEVRL